MRDIDKFKEITNKMTELFEKKNSNYGNSFSNLYSKLGPISALVPLHNKLDRITNLVKGNKNNFESLEDSLIDLANYSIMFLLEINRDNKNVSENISTDNDSSKISFVNIHGDEISNELLAKYLDEMKKDKGLELSDSF